MVQDAAVLPATSERSIQTWGVPQTYEPWSKLIMPTVMVSSIGIIIMGIKDPYYQVDGTYRLRSRLNSLGYAGFSPFLHIPRCNVGTCF